MSTATFTTVSAPSSTSSSPAPRGRKMSIVPAVPNIDYAKYRSPSRQPRPMVRSESFSSFTTPGVAGSLNGDSGSEYGGNSNNNHRSSSVGGGEGDLEPPSPGSGDNAISRNTWRNRKRRMRRNKARRAMSAARSEAAAAGTEVDPNFTSAVSSAAEKTLSGVNEAMAKLSVSDNRKDRQRNQNGQQQRPRSANGKRPRSAIGQVPPVEVSPGPLPARLEILKNRKEKKAATELRMAYVTVIPSKYANDINQIIRNAHPESIPEMQHLRRFVRPENVPSAISGYDSPYSTPAASRERSRSSRGTARSRERSMSGSPAPKKRGKRPPGSFRPLYVLLCYTSLMSLPELYELLSSHEVFSQNSEFPIPAITPHPVPKNQPASADQAKMLSELYWPTVYRRGNPYGPHPNIVDRVEAQLMKPIPAELNLHFQENQGISCAEYYMKLARLVADEGHEAGLGIRSGAVVVDFTDDTKPFGEIIAVASDGRHCGHPLAHASMRAIQLVGRKRVEIAKKHPVQVQSFDMNSPHTLLEQKYFELAETKKDGYLMHNLHVFVTHEPCVMCSMGLVHSRISACVMGRQMKQSGGLHADLAAPHNPAAARLLAGGSPTATRNGNTTTSHTNGFLNVTQNGGQSSPRSRSVSQYYDAQESQSKEASPAPYHQAKENQSNESSPLRQQSGNQYKSPSPPRHGGVALPNKPEPSQSATLMNGINATTNGEMTNGGMTNGGLTNGAAGVRETSPVRIEEIPFVGKDDDQASSSADGIDTLTVWDVEELRRGRSRVPAPHRPGAVKDGYSLFWRDRLNWKFLAFEWHDAQIEAGKDVKNWADDVLDETNI